MATAPTSTLSTFRQAASPRHAARHVLHAGLLFGLAASFAGAQVTATSDYLARMDADGNGRVSLGEYQDWMSYAFDGMDRNRDGVLSADELPGGKGRAIDRNAYRARIAGTFNRQDGNRDGSLDARELASPPQ